LSELAIRISYLLKNYLEKSAVSDYVVGEKINSLKSSSKKLVE